MKDKSVFIVEGGKQLRGSVRVSGAKNSAGHLLAASLLTNEETCIGNVPFIDDIDLTIGLCRSCGVAVERCESSDVTVRAEQVTNTVLPSEAAGNSRAPAIFIGALLARCGHASVPIPRGDKIGPRPLDRHLRALEQLGYRSEMTEDRLTVYAHAPKAAEVWFDKPTHMGTDNVLLVSAVLPGRTVIRNAAREPEVDDMIRFLTAMGADIQRTSADTIVVEGVSKLRGCSFSSIADRNEAVTLATAVLATRGQVRLLDIEPYLVRSFTTIATEAGIRCKEGTNWVHYEANEELRPITLETQPHPGFMTDWQPQTVAMLTQAGGVSTMVERVHSARFGYVLALTRMGADIELFDPVPPDPAKFYEFPIAQDDDGLHGCRIHGCTRLQGQAVDGRDIRGDAAIIVAALAAEGKSIIQNAEHICRGYDSLPTKLANLGASVAIE